MNSDQVRDAFEAWFEADALPLEHSNWFRLDTDGDYQLDYVGWCWKGWQAATASHAAEVEALRKALTKLCTQFPTDHDMAAAGWGTTEINEACNAYDAARAALKGD
jgi:hypothetical protein